MSAVYASANTDFVIPSRTILDGQSSDPARLKHGTKSPVAQALSDRLENSQTRAVIWATAGSAKR